MGKVSDAFAALRESLSDMFSASDVSDIRDSLSAIQDVSEIYSQIQPFASESVPDRESQPELFAAWLADRLNPPEWEYSALSDMSSVVDLSSITSVVVLDWRKPALTASGEGRLGCAILDRLDPGHCDGALRNPHGD